jgi:hypothetical protein
MRARHGAQLRRFRQAGKGHELRHIAFIEAARFQIGDVGEPFDLRRNIGETAVLSRRQGAGRQWDKLTHCHGPLMECSTMPIARRRILSLEVPTGEDA